MKAAFSVFAIVMLPLLAFAAAADKVYRWVDESGGVHYSATPPPGMSVPPSELKYQRNPDPQAARQQLQQYQDNVDKRRDNEALAAKENAKLAEAADKRAERCNEARAILERLRTRQPGIRYRREDGSYA